jgi:dipeptidyl-peptidase III
MFRTVLERAGDFMNVIEYPDLGALEISIDRHKIATHGKPALEDLALRLHIYRCTANVEACRKYYGDLTEVSPRHLAWRDLVLRRKPRQRLFVQPNTFLEGDKVVFKEYEPTYEGMIRSWSERNL